MTTRIDRHVNTYSLPKPIAGVALLISLACLLTAPGGIVLGVIGANWFLVAFEAVAFFSSVFGLLTAIGRFREAPALSLFCAGGSIMVAAMLAEPALVSRVLQGGTTAPAVIAGIPIAPFAIGRILAGALLVLLSAMTVLSRRPRQSLAYLVRGIVLGAPVAALGAVVLSARLRGMLPSLPGPLSVMLGVIGFFVVGALISLSAHNLIRAFEVAEEGRPTRS